MRETLPESLRDAITRTVADVQTLTERDVRHRRMAREVADTLRAADLLLSERFGRQMTPTIAEVRGMLRRAYRRLDRVASGEGV